MRTRLIETYLETPEGKEADSILRNCVHCGFCTATCPTYQLLGDELDGPRGRIYLIKQLLEGQEVSKKTQLHLDRCLTCRSCETTCPSGVRYGRLVDIGRELIEKQVPRSATVSFKRYLLRKVLPYPGRIAPFIHIGQWLKPVLPASIRQKVPARQKKIDQTSRSHSRRMLALAGCVQSVVTPETNQATTRVLDRLGIELITENKSGCCGAVSHHLSATKEGLEFMRNNIDQWWPHIEKGIEAIVITASGCGAMVKEYGELLQHDPEYCEKAVRVSELAKDISEVLRDEKFPTTDQGGELTRVAFHSPCTLQHAQKLGGIVESILEKAGYQLCNIRDSHLCCGSAGTYSILQPELSQQLLTNKLDELQKDSPEIIATANIGCQLHLATKADTPVKHWIELIDEKLGS
jgi:glycolate oxidase iron-sulfur subunit